VLVAGGVAAYLVLRPNHRGDTRPTSASTAVDAPRARANEAVPAASIEAVRSNQPAEGAAPAGQEALPVTSPGIELTVVFDRYQVTGSTSDELRADIDGKRPTGPDGTRSDAYTSWRLDWSWPSASSDQRCATGKVAVKVAVRYQLPELRASAQTPASLVAEWQRYDRALKKHEDGHRDFGIRCAEEIQKKLEALPPAEGCPAMNTTANDKAREIFDRYVADEKEYDRTTAHGATQGARFPCTPQGEGCIP
jgi:predicted secreted Zn-dependent protease